ncbi:plastocyanin/azurin family copper-binding protein [Nocardia jejuensis]|uniref:plastocyanin/azurin family copper-binding protein n=1 Tax=Nocardia jejuensis TaxID=328049 RepID=UPI003BB760AF
MHISRATACAAAAAALLSVSACGSGGDAPDNATPTIVFASGTDTPGMVPGGTSMPDMPDMPGMTGMTAPASTAASVPTGPNDVIITNFAFAPATLTVTAGTTVTWTNRDEEPHNVSPAAGGFTSPNLGTGATYTFTFTTAGSFTYVCSIHPFMHGTVVVTA